MSNIINQLANIPLRDSVIDQLDLNGVFENFARNYRKLDDLKNFRSEYEEKNFFSRWWNNDKLRDAQLDSAEVQAEFSKTLGQLVAISVIQAKELNDQQRRLGEQQRIIQAQVIAVREHSQEIERHQSIQEEQAEKLKQVVADYIAVKGISDESIHRLAMVVANIDRTKEEFFAESRRVDQHLSSELAILGEWVRSALSELDDKFNANSSEFQVAIHALEGKNAKTHQALIADVKALVQIQGDLETKLKELESSSRREFSLLDERMISRFQAVDGSLQGLDARATAAEQQTRENAERANQGLIDLEKKLKELGDASHHELALLDEKTASKFQAVDGSLQELDARATAAEQQIRENAERANQSLKDLANQLKKTEEYYLDELKKLDESTTLKLESADCIIQELKAKALAAEQQACESAERFKQLDSENASILKGCIGLQKEVAALRENTNKINKRFWFVLCLSSVGLLTALGVLGAQMMRV